MKTIRFVSTAIYAFLIAFIANCFAFIQIMPISLLVIVPLFLFINALAGVKTINSKSKKLIICHHGVVLLISFAVSLIVSILFHIWLMFRAAFIFNASLIFSIVFCVVINFIVFWNGIICVYLTSTQLGIKARLFGAICGMIPPLNVIALFYIIRVTSKECNFEAEKEKLNKARKDQKLCATKYPIMLVHGVFFRDTKYFNYWGRIPKELINNGAKIFYGNHQSAASIADSAEELKQSIKKVLKETGAEKVNIIAHSKGGLDCRYAISELGVSPYVASLTTINTPHRGCLFADYLLDKIPEEIQNKVATAYNTALKELGDTNPDFLAAVNNLTDEYCNELNKTLHMPDDIYCQSVGSIIKRASGGRFPLNFSYHIVKYFDGHNDGLVGEGSFKWGEKFTLLKPRYRRGISHGDMIDLNRKNLKGFDVREFYVNLVNELKNKGL